MKRIRFFSLLMAVCMLINIVYVPVAHAAGASNLSLSVDAEEVKAGDTVTVVISNVELKAEGFGLYLNFDNDLLTCTGLTGSYDDDWMGLVVLGGRNGKTPTDIEATYSDDVASTNSDGIFSFAYVPGNEATICEGTVATLTFTAEKSGTATFTLNEETAGTNAFTGVVATKTLVIKGSEPACDHEGKAYIYESNGDGTHKVKCECGEYKTESESCDGTATCEAKATCTKCGAKHGELAGHTYGELIPAKEAVHTKDELKGAVAAHYFCDVCDTYFTETKVETTLEALTGETPEHTVDPTKTTTETTPSTCTKEGSTVTTTFCACGHAFEPTTKTIPVDSNAHTWSATTYNWDGASCTATRDCEAEGCEVFEEEVATIANGKVTGVEKTPATCTEKGWTTYTANFDAEWAEDGKTNDVQDIPTLEHSYTGAYKDNGDGTHSQKCVNGCDAYGNAQDHDYTGDHICVCEKGEPLTVTVYDAGIGESKGYIKSSKNSAEYGKEFKTTLSNADKIEIVWVDAGVNNVSDFTFENNVLTIPADAVTGNIVIMAIASKTITIDPNGGEIDGYDEAYTIDQPCHLRVGFEFCYRTGYKLDSMNTKPDGTGTRYEVSNGRDGIFVQDFNVIEGGTLYAQWTPNTWTITWYDGYFEDPDNEEIWVETYSATTQATFGEILKAPEELPTKEGYKLAGWRFENDGGVVSGVEIGKPLTEEVFFATPIWSVECKHENTKAVDNGDGTHKVICTNSECEDVVADNVTHIYDETNHMCECEAVETFAMNFYLNEDDTEPAVTIQVPFGTALRDAAGDITQEFKDLADKATEELGETPTKDHYTFDGWELTDIEEITMPAGTISIYADWDKIKYTITWNLDGGAFLGDLHYTYTSCAYNETIFVITDPDYEQGVFTLVKEGYTFSHFEDGDGNQYVPTHRFSGSDGYQWSLGTMPGKNITLTAKWAKNCYIYIDPNGGTIDEDSSNKLQYTYGETLDDLNKDYITKEGHTFKEWKFYTDAAHTKEYKGTTVPAQDLYAVAQWKPKTYKMYVQDLASSYWYIDVPYGANFMEYIPKEANTDKAYINNPTYKIGVDKFVRWTVCDSKGIAYNDTTMPADSLDVVVDFVEFYGWYTSNGGKNWQYKEANENVKGWQQINHADYLEDGTGSDWYYFDEENDCYRAEGLTRVPYPTEKINGITYAPNAADVAYAQSKGETFIDATEGWFLFGEDGKFQSDTTGKKTYNSATRWIENGHIAWHPGMVKIEDNYFYFLGDVEKGGNILATQAEDATENEMGWYDITVSRANHSSLDREFNSGIYSFYGSGDLAKLSGMSIYGNYDSTTKDYTKRRFYGPDGSGADEYRLMCGLGLYNYGTEDYPSYIYVRSNGECVKSDSYWVPANNYGIPEGMYEFDQYGYMIIPEAEELKSGIYFEDGGWVYYEDGKIGYNAGLIEFDGTWYNEEGNVKKTGKHWIYVRSNGKLATGNYYVTNVTAADAPVKSGDLCIFDTYGILQTAKNGIVDGKYYINNQIAYNAGVVVMDDGSYIYVRSNGDVVKSTDYWVTNVGETGVVAKCYTFDANGNFTPEFAKDQKQGIVDGYYYVDGKIQYAAGVVEYNGGYIYVRSNGQIATGKYWATNTNGKLEAKLYDWGEDGILYL